MILTMARDRVHIPRICINILDVNAYRLIVFIYDFYAIEAHVEKITPRFNDVELNNPSFDSL